MQQFIVSGTVRICDVYYCDCEFCEGHGEDEIVKLDGWYEAHRQDDVLKIALLAHGVLWGDFQSAEDVTWIRPLVIREPTPAEEMEMTGARSLFDLAGEV